MNFEDGQEEDLDLSSGFDHGFGQVSEYDGVKEQSSTYQPSTNTKPIAKP
jgi:hypothetical protein